MDKENSILEDGDGYNGCEQDASSMAIGSAGDGSDHHTTLNDKDAQRRDRVSLSDELTVEENMAAPGSD